jgi:Rps23 Pro-64 3,4-dihydroxylase Tpa1-like proline 4-hydroxylase
MPETIFGSWTNSLDSLNQSFISAKPFEHVIIPNFLNEDMARQLHASFPVPHEKTIHWHHYDNPIEQKYASNDFTNPSITQFKKVFDILQLEETITLFRTITGISNLEADPLLHGAGLHAYPSNGKLDMHLDYSIHPKSGKERRCNLIYYLNDTWDPSWGGDLELRDSSLSEIKRIPLQWNTAVLFRTCDESFHGFPTPMRAPPLTYRKSLAIYYLTDPRPEATHRYKAQFVAQPGQPVTPMLKRLFEIRPSRLISPEDLDPDWRSQGQGYW